MGLMDSIKRTIIDVIGGRWWQSISCKDLIENMLTIMACKVIVRPSQAAVYKVNLLIFLQEHKLSTNNLPILSTLMALPIRLIRQLNWFIFYQFKNN